MGSGGTGPWAWNGEVKTLAEQVAKSVKLTMRGETIEPRGAADIAAYLKSLPTAPSLARARGTYDGTVAARGQVVFLGVFDGMGVVSRTLQVQPDVPRSRT